MRRDDRRGGAQQLMGGPYLLATLAVSLCRRFTKALPTGTLPDITYPDNLPGGTGFKI